MKGLVKKFKNDEKGVALVLVAIMLVVILGFAAFAVDFGAYAVEKKQMSTAADAAALAGAKHLPNDLSTAKSKAIEYALSNGYVIGEDNISFENGNKRIVVTIPTQNISYFAKVFGSDRGLAANAAAAAEMGTDPFWQLNPGIVNFKDNGSLELKGSVKLGSNEGSILVHSNGSMEIKENVTKTAGTDVYGSSKGTLQDKTPGLFTSTQTGVTLQPPLTAEMLATLKTQAQAKGQYFTSKQEVSNKHWTGVVYIDNKLEVKENGTITGGALIIVRDSVEFAGNANITCALYNLTGSSTGVEFKDSATITVTGAVMSLSKIEFKNNGTVNVTYDDAFISEAGLVGKPHLVR